MSRKQQVRPAAPDASAAPVAVTGTFYAVGKESHLLYSAWEIDVLDGVVVGIRGLSRAPDLAATAVGACTRGLWVGLRTMEAPDVG